MPRYPLYQKILMYKRKKENFSQVFFILRFSRNQFYPFFSGSLSPIELKIFLVALQLIWVGRFFFGDILCHSGLVGFAKSAGSRKPTKILLVLSSAQYFDSLA